MRIRFTWAVAVLTLVSIGLLMACSTKYSSSSNGLVVVPSQGGGGNSQGGAGGPVMESFSLNLANGNVSQINNVNGPPVNGLPGSIVLDPAGAFAYVVTQAAAVSGGGVTGIGAFAIASDGKLGTETTVSMNPSTTGSATCVYTVNGQTATQQISVPVTAPVVPTAIAIDSAGKLLFVSDASTAATGTYTCNGASVTGSVPVPGAVSVYTVANGSLTEVAGSPFPLPAETADAIPSASALAVTPTIFPALYAACSANAAATTENLYVTDSIGYVVLNYSVNMTSGALTLVPTATTAGVPTENSPDGVAVDPCNRFVYVSNGSSNSVSAYSMCSVVSVPTCPAADDRLLPVATYPTSDVPGPLLVDAYGKFLYVLGTGASQISSFQISSSNGTLTPLSTPTTATGQGSNSIAIRSDDSWLFVANMTSASVSQFAIAPATGVLTSAGAISTFNLPSGVAVK